MPSLIPEKVRTVTLFPGSPKKTFILVKRKKNTTFYVCLVAFAKETIHVAYSEKREE